MIASHSGFIRNNETISIENENNRIGIERTIETVQTNAIKFNDKSWLYFPPAKDSEETENGFIVHENYNGTHNSLTYEFIQ